MKLHNGGTLGLGLSRCVSNASLQNCKGTFFSILLFMFSAIKGPVKELKLSFTCILGEKYVNKIFLLLSGSESSEVSPNLTF